MKKDISSIEQLASFCSQLPPLSQKTLILLEGDLGCGKTEFVKQFWKFYKGEEGLPHSPSYSLQNIYPFKEGENWHHYDFYRLQSLEDLYSTGFWEIWEEEKVVIFVEWPYQWDISWNFFSGSVWRLGFSQALEQRTVVFQEGF